jgi:RHS repeat-associated protein
MLSGLGTLPAAATEDDLTLAERMAWTAAERDAYGERVAPEVQTEDPVPSVEVSAKGSPGDATTQTDPTDEATELGDEWPAAGDAEVQAAKDPVDVTAGGLDVSVQMAEDKAAGARSAARAPDAAVEVHSLGQEVARAAGVTGVLLTVESVAARAGERADVTVDYSDFGAAVGGDWASRLRLVQLPACALTTPHKPQCRTQTPLDGASNDVEAATVSAVVGLASAEPVVLAATAAAQGPTGDWSATSLSAEATWDVSGSSGNYTYSYPVAVPPAAGGLEPQIGLAYSSGTVDGRVSTTNNQTSVVGDGWDLTAGGYVERKYAACRDDMEATSAGAANNADHETGDLCWRSDNATMVLGGRAMELVRSGTSNVWRSANDDNSKVEHLTGAWNDDSGDGVDGQKEYWKLTTADGTQYFFGRDRRSATDTASLGSSWVTRVYGNHPGEPCYQAVFADSACQQTYRWNLDYVVDVHGNAMTYFYDREANRYDYDQGKGVAAYQRGGYLTRIEYGTRTDALTNPPVVVDFGYSNRCVPAGDAACETLTSSTKGSWPDVPFDLVCTSGTSCPGLYEPTYFLTKRLTSIKTSVRKADGTYRLVDQWGLAHAFPTTLPGPALSLSSITRTGTANGSLALPATRFGYTKLANRIDVQGDTQPEMNRFRLTSVTTEAGGTVSITYSKADCTPTSKPASPQTNTRRCFPVWYTPMGQTEPVMEYFHKYVVTDVVTNGNLAGAQETRTHYAYPSGGGAWRYTDDEILPPDQRTWSQWRGYAQVDVYGGAANNADEPQTHTRYRYFRGMNGDRAEPSGGTKPEVRIDGFPDHDQFAGMVREEIVYNGSAVVTRTLTDPWRSTATATASDGDQAFHVGTAATEVRTTLDSGVRTIRTETTFDTYGMPVSVNDLGDTSIATDDRCTRTDYVRNTGTNILGTVKRTETVAVGCSVASSAVQRPAQVISEERTTYDALAYGTAPTRGLPTIKYEAATYSSTGTPVLQKVQTTAYDAYGRPTSSADALGRTTKTAYTMTAGSTTRTTVTSPDPDGTGALTAHVTVTDLDPARGLPTKITDPAGNVTSGTYDALGRLTAVWEPGRTQGTDTATKTYAYSVAGKGIATVTTKTLNWDGSAYLTSSTLYDGLLRERQTQSPSADVNSPGRVVTDTVYDSRGLVSLRNSPWFTTGAVGTALVTPTAAVPGRTEYGYDGAGRTTAETFLTGVRESDDGTTEYAERWVTATEYHGDRTKVTPPAGGTPTTTFTDARGKTTAVRQHTSATAYQDTTYRYDAADRLIGVSDPAGNDWSYAYDLRGRQIAATDPDKGTTTSTYDAAGQVLTTTDARGEVLGYTYDALGRKTSLRDDTVTGTLRAQWTYDTLAKGQLTSATRFAGGKQYVTGVTGYDHHGRPLGQTVTIPAGLGGLSKQWTTSYTYTVDGRVAVTTLPAAGALAAEKVTTGFDAANQADALVTSMVSPSLPYGTIVNGTAYSPYGDVLQLDMGANYPVVATYQYQQGTRRLAAMSINRSTTGGLLDLNQKFSYDDAGNVLSVADTPTASGTKAGTECFAYDSLRRLSQAWTPSSNDCAKAPTNATLGGAAPYWTTWTHDAVGNRKTQVQQPVGSSSQATTTTYTYPAAGAARPHATTKAVKTGASTGTSSFAYDATGNMTTRTVTGQTAQTLAWDAEGELDAITESGAVSDDYLYDADGNRLLRTQDGVTTLYLPGGQEVTLSGTTVTAVRYYQATGKTVGMRTGAAAKGTTTIVPDAHGTGFIQVDQSTNTLTRRYTDPYGNIRSGGTFRGDHRFLDKPTDTSGLTAISARYYDPVLGRFISVDPLMDLTNPQQWNAYAYSSNNPTTWSDPTGLIQWDNGAPGSAPKQEAIDKANHRSPGTSARRGSGSGAGCMVSGTCDPAYLAGPSSNPEYIASARDYNARHPVQRVISTTLSSMLPVFGLVMHDCGPTGSEADCAVGAALGGLGAAGRLPKAVDNAVDAARAAERAIGPARDAERLRSSFDSLPVGKQKSVRTVGSASELRSIFDGWVVGGERLAPRGPKIPDVYQLPDGTVVQWRTESRSGGAAIDMVLDGGRARLKVHIDD